MTTPHRPLQPWLPRDTGRLDGPQYREYAPPPDLAPFVACVWTLRGGGRTDDVVSYRAVPDGCPDLIFETSSGGGWISGQLGEAFEFPLAPRATYVGVRLAPFALPAVARMPAGALRDATPTFEAVSAPDLAEIFLRWTDSRDPQRSVQPLFGELRRRLAVHRIDARARGVVSALLDGNGPTSVERAAQLAGLSARQLRRVVTEHVGLPPKHLARVLRFQRALRQVVSGRTGFAALAADEGYADQAHMIREFVALSGSSPKFWRDRASTDSRNRPALECANLPTAANRSPELTTSFFP